jgi:dihydroorotate dehydrogenase (NAD+) catalytic subunit
MSMSEYFCKINCNMNYNSLDCQVQLAPSNPRGLLLNNPVMTASGTFGYGTEYFDLIDIEKLGAIICKGTTLMPKTGNPQPRLVETAGGLLNSIGLENIGVDALIAYKAPIWANWQVPVIVNVAGQTVDEYVEIVKKLENVHGISGIELNVSCPNVEFGGIWFGTDSSVTAELTREVKKASSLPVMVKLGPNVTDITEIAIAAEEAGADAISLINTAKGMAIDLNSKKPCLGNIYGGLSGPAIKPIALYMVYEVAKAVHIPVIGCGGINCATDALEFLVCGASAVQVGTATLINPHATIDILQGIKEFMLSSGINSLSQLIGACQP